MDPYHEIVNHINCIMVSILSSSVVDNWFKPGRGQIKDTTITCFICSNVSELNQISCFIVNLSINFAFVENFIV